MTTETFCLFIVSVRCAGRNNLEFSSEDAFAWPNSIPSKTLMQATRLRLDAKATGTGDRRSKREKGQERASERARVWSYNKIVFPFSDGAKRDER